MEEEEEEEEEEEAVEGHGRTGHGLIDPNYQILIDIVLCFIKAWHDFLFFVCFHACGVVIRMIYDLQLPVLDCYGMWKLLLGW